MGKNEKIKINKPLVLVVLSGWGVKEDYDGNIIKRTGTPFWDKIVSQYPATVLWAHGHMVGLEKDQVPNLVSSYSNLGLGSVQSVPFQSVNQAIKTGKLFKNQTFLKVIKNLKQTRSRIHLVGLVSDSMSESSLEHLYALLLLLHQQKTKQVFLHLFLDGVDSPKKNGLKVIEKIEQEVKRYGFFGIASLCGRFYAMDKNNNWDRTEKVYNLLVKGEGRKVNSVSSAISSSYRKGIYDEELTPTSVSDKSGVVQSGDALLFFNHRSDGMRQLFKAFTETDFLSFGRAKVDNLSVLTLVTYEQNQSVPAILLQNNNPDSFSGALSQQGLSQVKIFDSASLPFATYFFNGRRGAYEKEEQVLIPLGADLDYASDPLMSAPEITKKALSLIKAGKHDVYMVFYSNIGLMTRHGRLDDIALAVKDADKNMSKLVKAALVKGGTVVICSDSGSAEEMININTEKLYRPRTLNPVPLIIINKNLQGRNIGWKEAHGDLSLIKPIGSLADVAPTVLQLLDIKKPRGMSGKSLV